MRRLAICFTWVAMMGTPALAQDTEIPCDGEPTDMTIGVGDIINCAISPIGDTDLFRFAGASGDRIILTLTDRTGGGPAPVAELFNPDGAPIDTLVMQDSGDRAYIDLVESGTYTVLLRESGDNSTVVYNLALQSLFPAPPETQVLCIDCEIADAIDAIGDTDVFQFDVTAGSTFILTLTDRTGGGPAPVALVYDSNRDLLSTLVNQDTGFDWMFTAPATDTYTVLVGESGDNSTVSYNLALQRLFPLHQTADCIEYGTVVEDAITPITDSDVYRFAGAAGTTVIVTLTDRTGGGPAPVAEIYGPSQTLLETLVNQDGSDSWQAQLTETGPYAVLVRESGFNSTVSYNLALQCVFPSGDACPNCMAIPVRPLSWGQLKTRFLIEARSSTQGLRRDSAAGFGHEPPPLLRLAEMVDTRVSSRSNPNRRSPNMKHLVASGVRIGGIARVYAGRGIGSHVWYAARRDPRVKDARGSVARAIDPFRTLEIAMTTHYDAAYWSKSLGERMEEARIEVERWQTALARSRSRLLVPRTTTHTLESSRQLEDVWGKAIDIGPIELVVGNDLERKLRRRQYVEEFRRYIVAKLEYERLAADLTRQESHRAPTTWPRRPPEEASCGPVGSTPPIESQESMSMRSLEELVRRNLRRSLRDAKTRDDADRLLNDAADAYSVGLETDPLTRDAMTKSADILEDIERQAEKAFKQDCSASNFAKWIKAVVDANMMARSEGKLDVDELLRGATRQKPPGRHVVRPGDTLSKLAREYYGEPARWPAIYVNNWGKIPDDPNTLLPNATLIIP